ncbi:hypothetical protein [Nocardia asteroides]|uniref:hypothetical protein n=1 Tax=Nocardia asteroides TaxID=1824 RepID=UPI001E474C13|nr:hypothetical protein [Nocardia asteroides]UGT60477.1 hypothetical protein LTT61_25350 [Nocardia asteroides]
MSGQRPPGDPVTTLSGYWPIVRPDEPPAPEPRALDARLVPAAVLCWLATIVAITAGWVAGLVLAALLVGTACGLWIWLLRGGVRRSDRWRVLVWGMVAALLLGTGFATAAAWREQRVAAHPLRALPDRASVQIYAVPTDDPKPVRGRSFGDQRRWVVRADLVEYRHAGQRVRAGGAVTILAGGDEWGRITPARCSASRPGRCCRRRATSPSRSSARTPHPWSWNDHPGGSARPCRSAARSPKPPGGCSAAMPLMCFPRWCSATPPGSPTRCATISPPPGYNTSAW